MDSPCPVKPEDDYSRSAKGEKGTPLVYFFLTFLKQALSVKRECLRFLKDVFNALTLMGRNRAGVGISMPRGTEKGPPPRKEGKGHCGECLGAGGLPCVGGWGPHGE